MKRWSLAIIAFFFHAPGLWLLAGYSIPRGVKIRNALAVGLTLVAMMYFSGDLEHMFLAWLTGHFIWGAYLGMWVLTSRGDFLFLIIFFVQNVHASKECTPSFPYRGGWLGADAAYSVPLDSVRDLWIFQDTFVGDDKAKSRKGAKIIPNSLGISECKGGSFSIRYFWNRSTGEAEPYFSTETASVRYWPVYGFLHDGQMFIFLIRVTASSGQFGFKYVGVDLATLSMNGRNPNSWIQEIREFSRDRTAFPGVVAAKHGEFLYIFSVLDGDGEKSHDLILTRLKLSDLKSPALNMEYFAKDQRWKPGLVWADAKRVMTGGSTELSVHFDETTHKWIAVQSAPEFLTRKGIVRVAENLWGPWSNGTEVLNFKEMERDKDTFCYAMKAHKQFGHKKRLLVTHVCNSFDFGKQIENMEIYRPIATWVGLPHF